jgi:hypothetical protein
MYQPYDRKEFAPWRAEFRLTLFYWLIGVLWFGAAIVWCARDPRPESIVTAEGAVLPLFFGFLYLDSARRRWHGSLVEAEAVKNFMAAAPSVWSIKADLVLPRLGNIDLLVRFPDGQECPIEIKSWQSAGKLSRRARALEQVRRQCEVLRARHGVVWLPKATNHSLFRRPSPDPRQRALPYPALGRSCPEPGGTGGCGTLTSRPPDSPRRLLQKSKLPALPPP